MKLILVSLLKFYCSFKLNLLEKKFFKKVLKNTSFLEIYSTTVCGVVWCHQRQQRASSNSSDVLNTLISEISSA